MKLTKKLLPALGMLALSASMLVTSTFAWFSMNTDVSVSGMNVKAVGEQVYLQIVNDDTDFNDNADQTTTTSTFDTITSLKPVTVGSAVTDTAVTKFEEPTETAVNAGANAKWVTSVSTDPNASSTSQKYSAALADLSGYVFTEEFKIRLNPSAGLTETTLELDVKSVNLIDDNGSELAHAVSVFVVLGNRGQLFTQEAAGQSEALDGTISGWKKTGDISLTTGGFKNPEPEEGHEDEPTFQTVTVYVFFDGEHVDCTSANLWAANEELADGETLNDYSVQVNFTLVDLT